MKVCVYIIRILYIMCNTFYCMLVYTENNIYLIYYVYVLLFINATHRRMPNELVLAENEPLRQRLNGWSKFLQTRWKKLAHKKLLTVSSRHSLNNKNSTAAITK